MATTSFLNEMMHTLGERGRALIGRSREAVAQGDLVALGELLLSRRGEASGVALARTLLGTYMTAPLASRLSFLTALADRFGPDRAKLEKAIEAYRSNPGPATINGLHEAAEARRQELIRR